MALFRSWRLCPQSIELIFNCPNCLLNPRKLPVVWSLLPSNWCALHVCRSAHTSPALRGLEEFFPKGDPIEEGERTGRRWLAVELRQKSNEDLHKLWYVLLKERNLLLTEKHEAQRLGFIMPAPERMRKVRKSMARIKLVLGERGKSFGLYTSNGNTFKIREERVIRNAKEVMKNGRRPQELSDMSHDSEDLSIDAPSHPHSIAQ